MIDRTIKLQCKIDDLVEQEFQGATGVSNGFTVTDVVGVLLDVVYDIVYKMVEEKESDEQCIAYLEDIYYKLTKCADTVNDEIEDLEDEDKEADEDDIIDRNEALRILRKARKHMAD